MNWQQTREDLLKNDGVQRMIAERAYLISESRRFEAGHEIEDWFRAENQVLDDLLRRIEAHSKTTDSRSAQSQADSASAVVESAIHEEPIRSIASPAPLTDGDSKATAAVKSRSTRSPKKASSGERKPSQQKATAKQADETTVARAKSASSKPTQDVKAKSPTLQKRTGRKSAQPDQSV